ncbi:MAG: PepSY domain-containing protein [Nitrospiraceae bacterium]|nr:PepSY domain-containing protein [Nitrospira sp.]MCB9775433.1 PepSY domain-containing protein [Nitrospiraceae bacterium]
MKNRLIPCLVMTTCILPVSSALALFEDDKAELLKGTQITLVEAVEKALTTVKGKAVDAELENEHGKTVFEVKIVDERETTKEVYVDAHSGEVVKIEKD